MVGAFFLLVLFIYFFSIHLAFSFRLVSMPLRKRRLTPYLSLGPQKKISFGTVLCKLHSPISAKPDDDS